MEVTCPSCGGAIAPDDVNVAKDVAFCRACNEAFELSELVDEDEFDDVNLDQMPAGVAIDDYGGRVVITASTRSGWALFWLIFVGMFGIMAPVMMIASQISEGKFQIGQTLFALPFMAVGAFALYMFLLMVIGRVQVTLEGDQVTIFTGVGSLGRTKTGDLKDFTGVRLVDSGTRVNNRPVPCIQLDGPKPIKFGTWLRLQRKEYVAAIMERLIKERRRSRL